MYNAESHRLAGWGTCIYIHPYIHTQNTQNTHNIHIPIIILLLIVVVVVVIIIGYQ